MSKNIQIIGVATSQKANKQGKMNVHMEVAFKDLEKGKVDGKTLVDFATDKTVWQTLADSKAGDTFAIETEKKGDYWNWVGIARQDAAVGHEKVAEENTSATPVRNYQSKPTPARDYETREERQLRQVLIVRQSSLASAVDLLKDHGKQPDPKAVLEVASLFEDWVMRTKPETIADMADDIPF